MIFTHLYIDNLYNFYKAELDLTIKRELLTSPIENEFLLERPKFKYKRLCILSGANASGKTSLGKIIWYISRFINNPNEKLNNAINDKNREAVIEVEFVTPKDNMIHYLKIEYNIDIEYPVFVYSSIPIRKNDSNYIARKRLKLYIQSQGHSNIKKSYYFYNTVDNPSKDVIQFKEVTKAIRNEYGWYYLFSNNDSEKMDLNNSEHLNCEILKSILSTFDSSIISVTESRDDEGLNGYNIKFTNKDSVLIDRSGEAVNKNRLSKGTYDAILVADFVAWVIDMESRNNNHSNASATYFLDEKMAYSHSEIEQAIVNLILQRMGRSCQFFYTTHNYDILDMNFPIHSYVFLKKEKDKAYFIQPENLFKKNDRSLLNYVHNNVFNTLPDTSLIDELL